MARLTNLLITGIASGAVFALLAIGIVLIYRVSRVINLAHGAIGVLSTYVFYFTFIDRRGLRDGCGRSCGPPHPCEGNGVP